MPKNSKAVTITDGPAEQMVVKDLETLRMLTDPLRLQILELMSQPHTVKEVALALKTPPTKLYYHVGLMEERGLIRVVETRVISGIIEKKYQVSAKQFKVDGALLRVGKENEEGLLGILRGVMDGVAQDIQQGLERGLIQAGEDAPRHRRLMFGRSIFNLAPTQAEELNRKFQALLEEYGHDNTDPQAGPYSVLIIFHTHSQGGVEVD
ncbi:MAG TPA: helix-turn-helix domain-containing protein [Meiothermus sp.]|nr:helix-turn-helix domain-containing protein [Meiothermus sp.]